MDTASPIDQVGGFIPDPDKKLNIEVGAKVTTPAAKQPSEPASGWRGIERFSKMNEDVLKENFGGIKVGFSVSQIPEKDSPTRKAGLKSGDVIYKVGDKEVTADMTLQEFLKLLTDSKGEVKLSIARKGGEKIEVTIGE
jgi:C-terminal processing protease CtpA/Prc